MSFECVLLPDTIGEQSTTENVGENILDKIPANYTGDVLIKRKKARHTNRCCVPDCSSKNNVKGISFHQFPKTRKLNKLWKIKCRLVDTIPSTYTVCSKHFLVSDYFPGNYLYNVRSKKLLKTAVPSQNLPAASYTRKRNPVQVENRAKRLLNRNLKLAKDSPKVEVKCVEKPSKKAIKELRPHKVATVFIKTEPTDNENNAFENTTEGVSINNSLKCNSVTDNTPSASRIDVLNFLKTRTKLNAWTGIQTFSLLRKIEERVSIMHPNVMGGNDMSLLECILMCFIKLNTKLSFVCLTSIFQISTSSAIKIFQSTLPFIKKALDDVDYFSSTIESKDKQLISLRMYGYNEARTIVDHTEGDIQNTKCTN